MPRYTKKDIEAVYDNGGISIDRYTVALAEPDAITPGCHDCLSLSDNPDHPQGFSQWIVCPLGGHLGQKIRFSDLPINVQAHVWKRLNG